MKSLTRYYVNYADEGNSITRGDLGPFDDDGIPLVDYNFRYKSAGLPFPVNGNFGVHYTPVTVSILALNLYDQIALGSTSKAVELRFYQLVDSLLNNLKPINANTSVWQHNFQIPFRSGIAVPYASGIAQALGISTLLRAFELSNQEKYLDAATRAFNCFYTDIEEGGVLTIHDGYVWLEEWPSNPRSHVLNGFMYSILSIYDYIKFSECSRAIDLLTSTLKTLEVHIEKYDAKFGSRYDLLRRLVVSESYHKLHINLLRSIYSNSNIKTFADVADVWDGYLYSYNPIIRRIRAFSENIYINSEYRECKARQIFRKVMG